MSLRFPSCKRGVQRQGRERGAVLVEFAIVMPLLLGLVLGMISFGTWYNNKLNLSTAAREGARYGATLPFAGYASTNSWLDAVAGAAVGAAGNQLTASVPSRYICVAYIDSNGETTRRADSGGSVAYSTGTSCYSDSLSESRVQVVVQRAGTINVVLFSSSVAVTGRAVARFEASTS